MKWLGITTALCVTGLLALAILKGIDGALLAGGLSILAGMGGYTAKAIRDKRAKPED